MKNKNLESKSNLDKTEENLNDLQDAIIEKSGKGMDRRDFLKTLSIATAGALLVPSSKILASPNHVEISGPDQLEVNDIKPYDVAHAGDWIQATNDNVYLSTTGAPNSWEPGTNGVEANSNKQVFVKGMVEGQTILQNWADSSDPDKDIEIIAEATPIILDHFEVLTKDGQPVLSWETVSETNNDHFEIERSFDGMNFKTIDTIDSKAKNGTSRGKLEYSYTDTSDDLSGTVYYRLKQVDKDGQSETFDAKTVVIENPDLAPTLYPNPVKNGQVTLEIFNKNQNGYRIVNMQGQTVADGDLILGQNTIQVSSLPAGEYVVQVKGGTKALKLIVQ